MLRGERDDPVALVAEGPRKKWSNNPLQSPIPPKSKCRARTRNGKPCQSPGMANGRCRMHGGPSPGAPKGNTNALKHGMYRAPLFRRGGPWRSYCEKPVRSRCSAERSQ
ncbi:HGGxSTG domain-containing protein [Bradyrhizobium sp.]|uniref:HGGxSTG domain-containing protein n=1 Tax=Bradyrhizobium sp. TaxID=376 RepID=UPI003BB1140C